MKVVWYVRRADIQSADKLILPGVGAFDHGIEKLESLGLIDILNRKVLDAKTPILGLCLGMQLFTQSSDEGILHGLGWIEAKTERFDLTSMQKPVKLPHMGWNYINIEQEHPIFTEFKQDARFYFVHSFHCRCFHQENVLATTNYGYDFQSVIVKDNIIGAQFHPEKSHKYGMQFMKNFVEIF